MLLQRLGRRVNVCPRHPPVDVEPLVVANLAPAEGAAAVPKELHHRPRGARLAPRQVDHPAVVERPSRNVSARRLAAAAAIIVAAASRRRHGGGGDGVDTDRWREDASEAAERRAERRTRLGGAHRFERRAEQPKRQLDGARLARPVDHAWPEDGAARAKEAGDLRVRRALPLKVSGDQPLDHAVLCGRDVHEPLHAAGCGSADDGNVGVAVHGTHPLIRPKHTEGCDHAVCVSDPRLHLWDGGVACDPLGALQLGRGSDASGRAARARDGGDRVASQQRLAHDAGA
mmetsp:Transcript_23766/g.74879  ORF Transcript_23766/g.74879 Transcript_23766/m.74879 type:complete len:287 (+) Transcript_23766:493-1353(+)